MKCKGLQVYFNPSDRKWHLDIVPFDESIAHAKVLETDLKDKEIDVVIQKFRKHRTLSMNAYYWVLNGKLAKAVGVSQSRMHNILLRRYGVPEIVDGCVTYQLIPDTDQAEETALEADTFHIKPTSRVIEGKDDIDRRYYTILKGSSRMTTDEMAALIDGTVDECKQVGIETMTPRELQELYEMERKSKC